MRRHTAVGVTAGKEHDVGDTGRQVDRCGPAQFDDADAGRCRVGVRSAQHQYPSPRQRSSRCVVLAGAGLGARRIVFWPCGRLEQCAVFSGGSGAAVCRRARAVDGVPAAVASWGVPERTSPSSRRKVCSSMTGTPSARGAPCLRGSGRLVVGHEDAGVPTDGGHHVQPGCDRAGNQLGSGRGGVPGDGDLHALFQRAAGRQSSRIAKGARRFGWLRHEL